MAEPVTASNFYNVKILKIYIAYLKNELGWDDVQIEPLFDLCDTDVGILTYDDNWFGQDVADCFHAHISDLTGDPDVAYKVGHYATHQSAKGIAGRVATGFLSPTVAYRNIGRISSEYSRGANLTIESTSQNHAVLKAVPLPECHEKPYQCRNRIGMLESIPTLFNLPNAVIEHPKCIHKGDAYCEYNILWIEQPFKFIPYLSVTIFIFILIGLFSYTSSFILSLLLSLGITGAVYSILDRLSNQRLNQALNEQIEALRISHDTLERRHQESSLVSEINLIVNRMLPIHQLCEVVTEAIHDKMGYDRVTIFLYDQTTNTLRPSAYTGFNQSDAAILAETEFRNHPGNTDGFLVAVMNTGKSIFVRDVDKSLSRMSERSQSFIKHLNVKSFTAVPIKFENRIFGVLAVDNLSQSKLLTDNDRELLASVAMPIGVSFSNAESYEKLNNAKTLLEELVSERTKELAAARDEAIRANSAKSLFLANMSHELRTPLNAIMGFSQLIHHDAQENNLDQIATDSQKVINSAKHLLSLISDLLDMSKIEAGKMDLHIETVNIPEMIETIKQISEELAKGNRNSIQFTLDTSVKTMLADEKKLKQILLNLISNACKFTKDGQIALSVRRKSDKEGYVLFEVRDTGIGIPKDKFHRLFNDFSQVDSSTSKKYGGTGLGLSLSKRFCEIMGGSIEVESSEGVGTTFRVFIPQNVISETETPPNCASQSSG